jgi:hypothetical protein
MRILFLGVMLSGLVVSPTLACGPVGKGNHLISVPPLAVMLDQQLPTAKLADMDQAKIRELRGSIDELASTGKEEEARQVEEQAMTILGYQKVWLRCGPGIFVWQKRQPSPSS